MSVRRPGARSRPCRRVPKRPRTSRHVRSACRAPSGAAVGGAQRARQPRRGGLVQAHRRAGVANDVVLRGRRSCPRRRGTASCRPGPGCARTSRPRPAPSARSCAVVTHGHCSGGAATPNASDEQRAERERRRATRASGVRPVLAVNGEPGGRREQQGRQREPRGQRKAAQRERGGAASRGSSCRRGRPPRAPSRAPPARCGSGRASRARGRRAPTAADRAPPSRSEPPGRAWRDRPDQQDRDAEKREDLHRRGRLDHQVEDDGHPHGGVARAPRPEAERDRQLGQDDRAWPRRCGSRGR